MNTIATSVPSQSLPTVMKKITAEDSPHSPDKLEAHFPYPALEHFSPGMPKPFLRITVCDSSIKNCIPKTHLCGLKRLVKQGALKTTAEKIDKLVELQLPLAREILTLVYEQLENTSFFFDRTVTYPVLFKCSFKNAGKPAPRFFLEVHETKKVFLLLNHPKTEIAQGSFKTVIKAYDLKDPAIYAYAFSRLPVDMDLESYMSQNEEEFLALFNGSKHIIKVYALHYYETCQSILMEYYPQDLFSLVEQLNNKTLSIAPETKVNYCRQILEAIQRLHAQNIIHRDIKADNFLIKDKAEEGLKLKIADFGSACHADDQDSLKLLLGTDNYLAPEAWDESPIHRGKPLDIWAAGCIFWLIWNEAAYPWYHHNLENLDELEDSMKEIMWFHNRHTPKTVREKLVWNMLHPNPKKRWTVEACLHYLNQYEARFK